MNLFWTIAAILVILWLLLEIGGIGGSLIHILLVIAVIIVVYRLVTGRNVVTGK
ncbi:MAG: lmo0937 family membrane protein [Thaumarchaeota archaeon]|nr:lmo0937 family membrane protein [Nitrososphaerota archaeon]